MTITKLPSELVSLIHHVELNKSGWWENSIQKLILSIIWIEGNNVNSNKIEKDLTEIFKINLNKEKIEKELEKLISLKTVIKLPDDNYKISEADLISFQEKLKEAEENETKSKNIFVTIIKKYCPVLDPEKTWIELNSNYLLPLIHEIGANTYQLVSGKKTIVDLLRLNKFISNYSKEIQSTLKEVIKLFLDPKNLTVKTYILRLLNAYFFVEASSLNKDTLDMINKFSKTQPEFDLFIDTNFLFSILELHDNPSNEAAILLLNIANKLKGKVRIKFYTLPITINEAKKVLSMVSKDFNDLRITPVLAQVSLEDHSIGNGIMRKFLSDAAKNNRTLTSEIYFSPYIKNMITIARSKQIELFNEKIDDYTGDEDVISDIEKQLEREKHTPHPKTYEQLEHDIVLWHFIKNRRKIGIESPLEAKSWIITIDYRLLGFDAFKSTVYHSEIPICVHPTSLIQLMQFWIPRTEEFDETIFNSIRMPFLLGEFDHKAEEASIKILEALGRFEDINNLQKDTITSIFYNDALRQKMINEPDIEKRIALIKEELITELHTKEIKVQGLENELIKEKTRNKYLSTQETKKNNELDQLKNNLRQESKENKKLLNKFSEKSTLQEKEIKLLQKKFGELKSYKEKIDKRNIKKWLYFKSIISVILTLLLIYINIKVFKNTYLSDLIKVIIIFIDSVLIGLFAYISTKSWKIFKIVFWLINIKPS